MTIAIHPMTGSHEIDEYFDTDLLAHDILPVVLIAENHNPSASFIVRKNEIRLLNDSVATVDPRQSPSVGSENAGASVGIAGAALWRTAVQ